MNILRRALIGIFVALLVALPLRAADDDPVGKVSRIQGAGMAMQNALPRPLKVGDTILVGDVLSTGKAARLEVTMTDGTTLTLGEKAVMVVSEFIMGAQPNAALRLLQGAFSATTGKIMQTADASFPWSRPRSPPSACAAPRSGAASWAIPSRSPCSAARASTWKRPPAGSS